MDLNKDRSRRISPLIREMKEIKLYVSPKYHGLITKSRDELIGLFPTDVPFYIFVNEDMNDTDCFIETNHGRIVVSIDEQLNELRLKLSEILDSKDWKNESGSTSKSNF